MKPNQLALFRAYGRPAFAANGTVIAALSTPDVDEDRYNGVLHRLCSGAAAVQFSRGPRDSAPVVSPNGALVVFLRAGSSGPAQLYAMPYDGGEPFQLAEHPLGASAVTFSSDGRTIAYLAAVPESGRYGTEAGLPQSESSSASQTVSQSVSKGEGQPPAASAEAARRESDAPTPDAEAPRRITSMAYRTDGRGFTGDQREQIFVLDLVSADGAAIPDSKSRQLTAETVPIGRPAFTPDGREVVYERALSAESLQAEIAAVAANATEPGIGRSVVVAGGDATNPVAAGDTLYYIGAAFDGHDFAGRTPGLWAVPYLGGRPRRLTDTETVHVDGSVGDPVVWHDSVLVAVADRGSVTIRAVPIGANQAPLDALPVLIGGQRVVTSFVVSGKQLAAVVADPASCGDVVIGDIAALIVPHDDSAETCLTDISAPLREAGISAPIELAGTAPDGYPVHGWLVLPPAGKYSAPHPVLLDVHGGPHASYGWGVFDEAQMYATNGYAVVQPNPRGSSGYGQAHGRVIVGALGSVDADDVLALLDAALLRDDLDAAKVGVMGGSYGGFMTSWLASHAPERFVAGISERAVNAWDSFVGSSDIGFFFADAYVGSNPAVQRAMSPLNHSDRINIPLLIIHSEQDWRCPIEQAQRLFVALRSRGAEAEMLLFPGEGHELSRSGRPKHRTQRFEAILDWWAKYLPVGRAAEVTTQTLPTTQSKSG
ncbi:MAG: S9 family peptidase [Nakamurella sp.]